MMAAIIIFTLPKKMKIYDANLLRLIVTTTFKKLLRGDSVSFARCSYAYSGRVLV